MTTTNGNKGIWYLYEEIPEDVVNAGNTNMQLISDQFKNDYLDPNLLQENKNFDLSFKCIPKSIKATTDTSANVGNKQSTIDRYGSIWNSLFKFCLIVKDYRTAIIVKRDKNTCCFNPESASVATLIDFMRFNVYESGQVLSKTNKVDENVVDYYGNAVICSGLWTCTSTLQMFSSAISKLHNKFSDNIGKEYCECCKSCLELFGDGSAGKACNMHIGTPHYYRRGNPALNNNFIDQFKLLKMIIKQKDCSRKTYALLPGQVRNILNHCTTVNDRDSFMYWTIIIIGIKQFLRISEILDLKIEDFVETLFHVDERNVKALAIRVQGKTDIHPVTLMVWDDQQCPEFSATRAIMLWIHRAGIESGPLFPGASYEKTLRFLQSQIQTNKKKCILGTHTLRKTAYLFAIFGSYKVSEGELTFELSDFRKLGSIIKAGRTSTVTESARHRPNSSSVEDYVQDAETSLQSMIEHGTFEENFVSKWKSIFVAPCSSIYHINAASKQFQLPIVKLAHEYITKKIGLSYIV